MFKLQEIIEGTTTEQIEQTKDSLEKQFDIKIKKVQRQLQKDILNANSSDMSGEAGSTAALIEESKGLDQRALSINIQVGENQRSGQLVSIPREQFAKLVQVDERILKIEQSYQDDYQRKVELLNHRIMRVETQLHIPKQKQSTQYGIPQIRHDTISFHARNATQSDLVNAMSSGRDSINPVSARTKQANSTLSVKRSSLPVSTLVQHRVLSPVNVPRHIQNAVVSPNNNSQQLRQTRYNVYANLKLDPG